MNAPRHVSHDETVVKMLKAEPDFANEYLAAALEEAELPGGQTALLAALRHIAEAQGMSAVADDFQINPVTLPDVHDLGRVDKAERGVWPQLWHPKWTPAPPRPPRTWRQWLFPWTYPRLTNEQRWALKQFE